MKEKWAPRKMEWASLPWVCNSCGMEGFVSWNDYSHAYIYFIEKENARLREMLDDIAHAIYGNEATLLWVEKKARAALKEKE